MTALTAAAARAAHLIVDSPPVIFADPLAGPLLGERVDELIAYHRTHGRHPILAGARVQTTYRSRVTEDVLGRAVDRGTRQYVLLGAGLDSFAHRADPAVELTVFEVDHPDTQRWKRERLAALGRSPAVRVSYVPIDFEADDLATRLVAAGFDLARPAVVSWLGVSMYLTAEAITATLATVGRFARGTELVLDYHVPPHLRDAAGAQYADLVGPVAAEHGEPWRSCFTPQELTGLLRAAGFGQVAHTGQHDLDPQLWDRQDGLRPAELSRVVHARVA